MAEATLLQHRHCMICGKAMLGQELTCSDACKETLEKRKSRRKLLILFWFTLVAFSFVLYSMR